MSAVNGNVSQAVGTGLTSVIQLVSNNPPNGASNRPIFADLTIVNNDDGGRQEYAAYLYPSIYSSDFVNVSKRYMIEPAGRKLDPSGLLTIANLVIPANYSLVVAGSSYLTFIATTVTQDNVPGVVVQSYIDTTVSQLYSNTGSKSANADIILLNHSNAKDARYQVFLVPTASYVAGIRPVNTFAITPAGRKIPITSGTNISNIMVPPGYSLVAVSSIQITAMATILL